MFSLRSSSKPAPTDGSHAHAAHSKRGRPNDAAELAALIREARAAFADAGATDAQLVGSGEEGLTDAQVKRCVVCSVCMYVDCVRFTIIMGVLRRGWLILHAGTTSLLSGPTKRMRERLQTWHCARPPSHRFALNLAAPQEKQPHNDHTIKHNTAGWPRAGGTPRAPRTT
jgi:hypothetical protein